MKPLAFIFFSVCLPINLQASTIVVCDDVADPAALDPHLSFDNKAYGIFHNVYEGLVRLDKDGNVVPSLAQSWDVIAGQGLRFHLRQGARFHDGTKCDAQAVRESLKRQLKLANSVTLQLGPIRDVIAESTSNLRLDTDEPPEVALRRLAVFGLIVPIPLAASLGERPVGTGPYRFASWKKGAELVLEHNPQHWESQPPYFKRIVFKFIPIEKQIDALINGEVDLVAEIPGTRTLEVAKTRGLKIVKQETLVTHTFWFTNFRGPLARREIRQALNLAINKEDMIRYGALGNGKPLATFSMKGEVGHDPTLAPYPYNPELAKRMLAKAGWPKDFILKMFSTQQSERESRMLKKYFEQVGLKVELEVRPIKDVTRIISENRIRDYDVFANQAPDPLAHVCFLASICLHSRSPASAGGVPGFDERYQTMMQTHDPQEHERLARELDRWIYDEALGLFTYQRIRTFGLKSGLKYSPHFTGMLMNLDQAVMEDEKHER